MKTTQTFSILIWADKTKRQVEDCAICTRITIDVEGADTGRPKERSFRDVWQTNL